MKTAKKSLAILLSVLFALSTFAFSSTLAGAAGDGSSDNPYQISTYAELKNFAATVNGGSTGKCAVLTADIVCKNSPEDEDYATDWTPIGNNSKIYTGTFDGMGHKIIGLSTSADCSDDYVGLFGNVGSGGTVQNFIIEGGKITGNNYVGGVVGKTSQSTIANCYNAGSVSGTNNVGGVVGYVSYLGTVQNCYNTGVVSGSRTVGGVVGKTSQSTIANCYNTGNVSGTNNVGGVVGENSQSTTINCYNSSDISGSRYVGGVAGENSQSTITNCYNIGSVSGTNNVGGVVGDVYSSTTANCYYDRDKCACTGSINGSDDDANNVKGLTTAEMTGANALSNLTGFSSENWLTKASDFYSYYPHLRGFAYDLTESVEDWPAKEMRNNSGIAEDPYRISTYAELKAFADFVNGGQTGAWAVLTADIVCKNSPEDEDYATDWTPIGNDEKPYTGTFDGCGHIITGLTFENLSADNVGLFGYIGEGAEVKNIGLEGGSLTGNSCVGGVVGYIEGGTVENCYNTGALIGQYFLVGGVAGDNYGTITNCYNAGSVFGGGLFGGVAGHNKGTIANCYNTGAVSFAGGIISTEVGGVVGENSGTVQNCYNTGAVSGTFIVGGIVGWNIDGGSVTNSYNTGVVSGSGVAGNNDGTVENCYYDKNVCGDIGAVSGGDTDSVKGLKTVQMTGANALTNLTGFSSEDWLTKERETGSDYLYYPHLKGFNFDDEGNQLATENIPDENWPAKTTYNGTDITDGTTPQFRINEETNFWEVSYDDGETWESLGVKATGENGTNGTNGQDGITPKLRINEETNYWEVSYDDGETWTSLGVKATGENGQNGQDGNDGEDGITPQLKIGEDNFWYVSYDNGTNWECLNIKATGENGHDGTNGSDGHDGNDGQDGVGIKDVKIDENGNLIVTLTNDREFNLGKITGENGANGSNGTDGQNGADGKTPSLRINTETLEWEVSYDDGATWTSLGIKATGEAGQNGNDGQNGADGKDGEDGKDAATITGMHYNDNGELIVTMSDGTEINAGKPSGSDETEKPVVTISGYEASRSVDYGTQITFHASADSIPDGCEIHFFLNGEDQGASDALTVNATGNFNVSAKLMKGDSTLSESKTEKVNVKSDFFSRIIAFFKKLFNANAFIIDQK